MPFGSDCADMITVENTPLRAGAAAEIARVIRARGTIVLVHPADYAVRKPQEVIIAVSGNASQQTTGGITTTTIRAP